MNLTKTERKLTRKQTALVDYLVANGGTVKDAAHAVGYADGESGRVSASKALGQSHVQAYMMEKMRQEMGVRATLALSTVTKLAGTAKSEYVQLEASKDLLDRAGFKAPDKHMHLHAGDIRVEIDLG